MSRYPEEVADTFAAKAGKMQDASLYIYDAEVLYTALREAIRQRDYAKDEAAVFFSDAAQLSSAVNVLKSIRDNWDCDNDAHKYSTPCRCCMADKILNDIDNAKETNDHQSSSASKP